MKLRQIVPAPDAGEVRIPALAVIASIPTLFFDHRPAPATGNGSDFTGTTLASDLPNPNHIHITQRGADGEWSDPIPLSGPEVSSDAAVAVSEENITVAFASGTVGYFESRRDFPTLEAWIGYGSSPAELEFTRADALYDLTNADALFATSGSTIEFHGAVLIPYVTRTGDSTAIYVVHVSEGEIKRISHPIEGPDGVLLDETTLDIVGGRVVANFRVQGFVGRGSGVRYVSYSDDALTFSTPRRWELPDPGCNAKQLGGLFVHPHSGEARENGSLVRVPGELVGPTSSAELRLDSPAPISDFGMMSPAESAELVSVEFRRTKPAAVGCDVLARFGSGGFGYSDATWVGDTLLIVFERDDAIWEATLSRTEISPQ